MLEAGATFAEKYVLRELLGEGGFARVYRAFQPAVRRDVAIKVMNPAREIGLHPETLQARFHREANLAAKLRHQTNIRLLDFGEFEQSLFMIFEFVEGLPLDQLVRGTGRLPVARCLTIVRQVLEGLSEAHRLGFLHRDIKPANVMVFADHDAVDRVKVIDYGIAKPMDPGPAHDVTVEGNVVGTLRYMAPEQILLQDRLTPAADIYSVGIVLYEMLTGASPLSQLEQKEVIVHQLSAVSFKLPETIDVPPPLRSAVNRMLEKSPEKRFQSAAEALEALASADGPAHEIELPVVPDDLPTLVDPSEPQLEAAPVLLESERTEPPIVAPAVETGTPEPSSEFEQKLLTGDGKWWEFLDTETYQPRGDLPAATRATSSELDWSRSPKASRPGPVGFAFFSHCEDCGQGVPPDFTFCVHCGGAPRRAGRRRTYTVVIARLDSEAAREAAIELVSTSGIDLQPDEVARVLDDLPAVFNVDAQRDQMAALTAKLAEVGIAARGFSVDDPSIPWVRETIESVARQPRKASAVVAIALAGIALTWLWSALALFAALAAIVAVLFVEFRWYRHRYSVDVHTMLELLTGFDPETAEVARQTLRSMSDREARSHVTMCLMEYYALSRQIRAHGSTYGQVLSGVGDALEELMADVLTLAHRYARLDDFVRANPPARLEQRLAVLRERKTSDSVASAMVAQEIEALSDQLKSVAQMESSRDTFRERLAALAGSMELMRTRFLAVQARPSEQAFREMALDEALRELDEEFEVFEETFSVVG